MHLEACSIKNLSLNFFKNFDEKFDILLVMKYTYVVFVSRRVNAASGDCFSANISHFFCSCLNFTSRFVLEKRSSFSFSFSNTSLCKVARSVSILELVSSFVLSARLFILFTVGSKLDVKILLYFFKINKNLREIQRWFEENLFLGYFRKLLRKYWRV